MRLENRILALIAVGASVAANCQPCLESNVRTSLECGADAQQIAEAIAIGKKVRQGAASKFDHFAASLQDTSSSSAGPKDGGCGCDS
jgi:AhpD family alkylhydroperoxidase